MNNIPGNGNNRCEILEVAPVAWIHVALSSTHRISTAVMSSNGNIHIMSSIGNIHIRNRKQSYNMNTGTWNNNTCNRHGDLYDKNIEKPYKQVSQESMTGMCNSNMPVIHVTMITIIYHDGILWSGAHDYGLLTWRVIASVQRWYMDMCDSDI